MTRALLFLAALAMTACAISPAQSPPGPPGYQQAFAHGCSSGHNACGNIYYSFTKDVSRYLSDREYSTGWDDGYRQCRSDRSYPLTGCR